MDKIAAMARNAELRGAMAAFVDAGLVKVASQEAFDHLVDTVDCNLGDGDYDLQKVAMVTDAVIADYAAQKAQGQTKTAAQQELEYKAALGDLLLQKMAGQISDEDFVKLAKRRKGGVHAQAAAPVAAPVAAPGYVPPMAGTRGPRNLNYNNAEAYADMLSAYDKKVPSNIQRLADEGAMRRLENADPHLSVGQKAKQLGRQTGMAVSNAAGNAYGAVRSGIGSAWAQPWVRRGAYGLGGAGALAGLAYGGKALYDNYYGQPEEVVYGA